MLSRLRPSCSHRRAHERRPWQGAHFRGGVYRIELGLDDGHQLVAWSPERLDPGSTARFDIDATRISWFDD